ncbi:Polyadenylate-binding protein-interacting protein 8 [Vitis vinifera]|uniref:Polyadenylate-binding protein-interacting protein 8 n=1 Tax=Vitis vinifera TaxID=29760 RepID=A0A438I7I9_VITVI|nr:Polyadenylate-binding protein-interacting protein 8 [Vitis vinifera]
MGENPYLASTSKERMGSSEQMVQWVLPTTIKEMLLRWNGSFVGKRGRVFGEQVLCVSFGRKERLSGRAFRAQREDSIRRTVYVSDIDQHVTEERLAALFSSCGQVSYCVCFIVNLTLEVAFAYPVALGNDT